MNKKTSIFIAILSTLIGICSLVLIYIFSGTDRGDAIELFLLTYWSSTNIGFIVFALNYEKMKCINGGFVVHPLNLFLPLVNVFALFVICCMATEDIPNNSLNIQRKIFKKDSNKMTKKFSQLNSLNALKEIFDLLTTPSNFIDINSSERSMSTKKLAELIIFLENNYQKDEYSKLLIDFEITFVKFVSIYNESINTHIVILDEILISSKQLLYQFANKVNELQVSIEVNDLVEKENKNMLEIELKEKSKERLLKEIDDEIQFHKNK